MLPFPNVFGQSIDHGIFGGYQPPSGYYGRYFDYGDTVKFSGNALIYGSDPYPENDYLITVYLQGPSGEKNLLVKDLQTKNGAFDISFPITEDFEIGKYTFELQFTKGAFQGELNEDQSPFYVARKGQFEIQAEGQSFPVYVESVEFEVSNMIFDKESKSLSFDVRKIPGKYASDDYLQFPNQVGMVIKRPLIDAPFSILVNGSQAPYDPYATTIDNEFSKIQVLLIDIESTTVSVVGAYAVPEYPAVLIPLISAITFLLLIQLKNRRINLIPDYFSSSCSDSAKSGCISVSNELVA